MNLLSADLLALLERRDLPRTLSVVVDSIAADGTAEPLYLSTASGLVTEPEDEPASTPFEARLLPGRRWVQAITDGPSFGGGARPFSLDLEIENGDGRFDPWLDPGSYTVRGRSVSVHLGGPFTVARKPFPWSSSAELGTAVVTSWGRSTSNRNRLHMTLSGVQSLDDQPAVSTVWGGWGGGLQLEYEQSWGVAADAAHLDLGLNFTVGWTGRLLPEGGGTWRPFLLKGGGVATCQYGIGVNESLQPVIFSRGGHGGTGDALPVDERIGLCLRVQTVDGVSTAELWQRSSEGAFARVLEPLVIPTPTAATGPLHPLQLGRQFAMQSFVLYEAWGASRLLDESETRQWMARPLNGDEPDLEFLYKAEDRTGAIAADELERSPLGLTGDPSWVSSLEGDDPTRFQTGIAGMSAGRTVGPCRSAKAQLVDSSGQWYRWSDRPSDSPSVVYSQGVPVVQDLELISDQIEVDASSNALKGPAGIFRRLVPGQSDPYRPGQRIDLVTNAEVNDGTYEIAAEGISDDFSVCRLVEPLTTSESTGKAVIVRSSAPQVFIDTERSALSTDGGMGTPPGDLVVDVLGDPQAVHTASAQYALWSGGRHVESVLEWDPVLAIAPQAGPPTARSQILRRILDSCHGWARELPDGTIRIGNWPLPDGATVGSLGRFRSPPASLSTVPPYWNVAVGYGRVWFPLSTVAESVSASERERLQTPFRWVDDPRPEVREAHATAGELRLETYLPDLSSAKILLARLVALHGVPRSFWELSPGPEVLRYQPSDRLLVTAEGAFADGLPLVATYIDMDPTGSQAVLRGYR